MTFRKPMFVAASALVACMIAGIACETQVTQTAVPDPDAGQVLPTVDPPLTAFLSADRSRVIRGDANEGSAELKVATSRPVTFEWSPAASTDLLDIEIESSADPATESVLRILRVLSDPGPEGASVLVSVAAMEVAENGEPQEPVVRSLTIQVVRPASELAVSISADSARVAPRGTVNLTASVIGGTPFEAAANGARSCDTDLGANEFAPPTLQPPYCITWTVDETGLMLDGRAGGSFTLEELITGDNGEELSEVGYAAPLGTGSVSFRVDVSDQRGNRATATLAISVNSERELDVAEGTAASIEVAPGRTVDVSATAGGGEAPYIITFLLLGTDPIGELASSGCTNLIQGQSCAVDYTAPPDKVGAVQIRVTIEDAVGATSSTVIPLTVASPQRLNVEVFSTSPAVQPNSTTQITAEVSGGTPPYTVCYGFRDTPQGTMTAKAADCDPDPDDSFLEGFTLCTCNVGSLSTDGLESESIGRDYRAPSGQGADTIVVRTKDATGAEASSALSINIASSAGGSGTGGTGTVSLNASVDHPILCAGLVETATITAATTGGTGSNTFTFEFVGAPLTGEDLDETPSSDPARTYTPPTAQGVVRSIKITVVETGGSTDDIVIQIETINPATNCIDGNDCTGMACEWGVCLYDALPAGTSCGDGTGDGCTNQDTCDGGGTCVPNDASDGTACDDSLYCNENETCTAGVCGGGNPVDCDDGLTCTVDVCDEGADQCDHGTLAAGTCLIAGICRDVGDTNPANECQECNPAINPGAWSNKGAGALCGNPANTLCTAPDTCDGAGACLDNHEADGAACTADTNDCTDDVCGGGLCTHPNSPAGTACGDSSTSDCDATATCNGSGVCEANPVQDGDPCTDDGFECTDDICSGGICTHPNLTIGIACGDPTDTECDDPDTCDGAGVCLDNLVSPGIACGVPADTDCTDPDTCDGAGACVDNDEADGTGCTADTNDCTDDVCSAGICTHPNLAPGTACGNGVNDLCTSPDTCDGAGTCLANHKADGTACADEPNDCTEDTCAGGLCTHPNLSAGTACGDGSTSDCDAADTCNGAGVCETNPVQDGDPCPDDGNDCTDDVCAAAVCTHPDLPLGDPCGDLTDTECDDPDSCDGAGVCLDNLVGSGDPCGDASASTCDGADTCDGLGTCQQNVAPFNTACGDSSNNQCTDPDICDGFGNCDPRDMDAGTSCGSQSSTECDGANICDGSGLCSENFVALGTACTDDGNVCTDNECDGAGSCEPYNNSASCDDGVFCNGPDTCSGGSCSVHDGDPCVAGPECADTCNEGGSTCNLPAGASCGDGTDNECTDPDTCDGAGACQPNHEPATTVCRAAPADCDAPEFCTGSSAVCPVDVVRPDTYVCRTAAGDCDAPEFCDGSSTDCPNDEVLPDTTVCRAAVDECDVAELCDGASADCPVDGFEAAATACGDNSDTDCTNPDTCDGAGQCLDNDEPVGTGCNGCPNDPACECDGAGTCVNE